MTWHLDEKVCVWRSCDIWRKIAAGVEGMYGVVDLGDGMGGTVDRVSECVDVLSECVDVLSECVDGISECVDGMGECVDGIVDWEENGLTAYVGLRMLRHQKRGGISRLG